MCVLYGLIDSGDVRRGVVVYGGVWVGGGGGNVGELGVVGKEVVQGRKIVQDVYAVLARYRANVLELSTIFSHSVDTSHVTF